MSAQISYSGIRLDLPYMPCEEYINRRSSSPTTIHRRQSSVSTLISGTSISSSTSTAPTDHVLPSFEDAVNEQLALTVQFAPTITVKYTKTTRVKKLTTKLVRHVVEPGMSQKDEILAQWDLLSGKSEPIEGQTLISQLQTPLNFEPSTQIYSLNCPLPARLPETAFHKSSSKLWYTLDTCVERQLSFFSTAGPVEYSEEVVICRDTQTDAQSILPVNASVPWLNKLKYSISYPQKHVSLREGAEIPVKLTVTLFDKPIRLNTLKFGISQICNSNMANKQHIDILTDSSSLHLTSDLVELDKIELDNAREMGFEVGTTFLDSTHKGNLLIPGSEETVLDYNLRLDSSTIQKLSASTSSTHPLYIIHKLATSLRFSYLAPTDLPNQLKRRYFDVSISTPLVLSRSQSDIEVHTTTSAGRTSIDYEAFLLCEYPRLKNVVFENEYANDSAPSYDSLLAINDETPSVRSSLDVPDWSAHTDSDDESESDTESEVDSDFATEPNIVTAPITIPHRIPIFQAKQEPVATSLPSYTFAQNY